MYRIIEELKAIKEALLNLDNKNDSNKAKHPSELKSPLDLYSEEVVKSTKLKDLKND